MEGVGYSALHGAALGDSVKATQDAGKAVGPPTMAPDRLHVRSAGL